MVLESPDRAMKIAIFIVIAVVVGSVGTALLIQFVLRYIYTYDIYDERVRVLLFSVVPIFWVPISEIREAKYFYAHFFLRPFWALRFGNRLWGEGVILRKRRGLIRSIIITPEDARSFIEEIGRIQARE
jgi:hypothetical protein